MTPTLSSASATTENSGDNLALKHHTKSKLVSELQAAAQHADNQFQPKAIGDVDMDVEVDLALHPPPPTVHTATSPIAKILRAHIKQVWVRVAA